MADALAMLERLIEAIEAAEARSGGILPRETLRLAGEARQVLDRARRQQRAQVEQEVVEGGT